MADRSRTDTDTSHARAEAASSRTEPIVRLANVQKFYGIGRAQVYALSDVSLQIERGQFVAVMGPSGSGKSTLLHILGCLDKPSEGKYCFDGVDTDRLSERALARLRNQRIGFVFQSYNLLPRETALENVSLPLIYAGANRAKERAQAALAAVGLAARAGHRPGQLSGGEQQRVAIARALVKNPDLLLADEPTGNLDSRTAAALMELVWSIHKNAGLTIVLITHNPDIAAYAERIIRLRDGRIVADLPSTATGSKRPGQPP